jgi:hypothetical protein
MKPEFTLITWAARLLLLLALKAQVLTVHAQPCSIAWYKVSGGGGTSTNGTNYLTLTPPTGNLFFRLTKP